MEEDSFLSEEEKAWRRHREDPINYRDYLGSLPESFRRILSTRVPGAVHTPLPSKYVASALVTALQRSGLAPAEYTVQWHKEGDLVMTARVSTESSLTVLAVLKSKRDRREAVILVSSDDVTALLSEVDEVLHKLRENLREKVRELKEL
jgi:hypothetical protein